MPSTLQLGWTGAPSETTSMELGHLPPSPSGNSSQAPSQKRPISLLDLPNELLLLIFECLCEDELYSLALLCRRLHHVALPICLVRCGLSKSSSAPEKLVLFVDKALAAAQKRGLLRLRISLDITSLKRVACDFHFPKNTLIAEVRFLHRLMEKLTSVEDVILDFNNIFLQSWQGDDSQDETMRYWDKWSRHFMAILNAVASMSSTFTVRQRNPEAQRIQWSSPIHSIQPENGSSRHNRMSIISRPVTTIQKIVGIGKPSLSKLVRRESANRPDMVDSPSKSSSITGLNTLTIGSSMLFHPSFSLWTIQTLNNSPINTLTFDFIGLSFGEWRDILPIITLPVLSVLSIDSCEIALVDLSTFLSRHPSLTTLSIGASSSDLNLSIETPLPELLSRLTTLSAPTNCIVKFLTSAHKIPKLLLKNIVSHVMSASEFTAIHQAVASAAAHRRTDIILSLELHVHTDWLDMDAGIGIDGDDTLAQRVTSLVIKTGWLGLNYRDRRTLPTWLARFWALEKLTFVSQSRWLLSGQAKVMLIRSISAACPGVKTIAVNDEARDIGTWLAM